MKKQIIKILFPLLLAALGGLVGYSAVYFFAPSHESELATPILFKLMIIPSLLLAIFFVILAHELGHVAAGLGVGFEFRLLTVGPFMIEKEGGKLKFKWNTNLNTAGGLALCLPKNNERITQKFMLFAAGGPAMSLLLATIAYLLTWSLHYDNQVFANFVFHTFFTISAFFSLVIFLVTIVPMQAGGFYTDGGRILNLWRGGYQAKLEAILLNVTSQLFAGMRPSQIDIVPIQEALNYPIETSFKAYLHSFLYYYYLDNNRIEEAAEALELYASYLEQIPSGYQAMIWLEKAFLKADFQDALESAQDDFKRAKIGAIIPKSMVLRVEAALAKAEKNYPLATQKAEEALKELPNSMDKGTAIFEREWLNELLSEVKLQAKMTS